MAASAAEAGTRLCYLKLSPEICVASTPFLFYFPQFLSLAKLPHLFGGITSLGSLFHMDAQCLTLKIFFKCSVDIFFLSDLLHFGRIILIFVIQMVSQIPNINILFISVQYVSKTLPNPEEEEESFMNRRRIRFSLEPNPENRRLMRAPTPYPKDLREMALRMKNRPYK
jgi:hypothetical protein